MRMHESSTTGDDGRPSGSGRAPRGSRSRRMPKLPDQTGRRIVVTGVQQRHRQGDRHPPGRRRRRRRASPSARRRRARPPPPRSAPRTPRADVEVRELDLADLASVRRFAAGIVDEDRPLDVLVNNAGVMAPPERFETVDGFELQFGTNFLGPFALTNLLHAVRCCRAEAPRVVTMSSLAAIPGRIRFADLQWQRGYSRLPRLRAVEARRPAARAAPAPLTVEPTGPCSAPPPTPATPARTCSRPGARSVGRRRCGRAAGAAVHPGRRAGQRAAAVRRGRAERRGRRVLRPAGAVRHDRPDHRRVDPPARRGARTWRAACGPSPRT